MSAAIVAARQCGRTLLSRSLRVTAFTGAIPHVMLVVDNNPCTLQKVLVEGYRQTLEEINGSLDPLTEERAAAGHLYIPLNPTAACPCGSGGIDGVSSSLAEGSASVGSDGAKVSYSVAPFHAERFMDDMHRLQAFLRLCGPSTSEEPASAAVMSEEDFLAKFREVEHYLRPLPTEVPEDGRAQDVMASPLPDDQARAYATALRQGPKRELLCFILVQRNAFQNELKQYRLRLALFNMGMRVVEHCHLEIMSMDADARAEAGHFRAALEDDQVVTYPRSCSCDPADMEAVAKAIAETIDLQSWQRAAAREPAVAVAAASPAPLMPPPGYLHYAQSPSARAMLSPKALQWHVATEAATLSEAQQAYDAALSQPITGAGAPLRIVSRGAGGAADGPVLTFGGGLEDCLMNTGYYPAADLPERNHVVAHRQRFPTAASQQNGKDTEAATEEEAGGAAADAAATPSAEVHGRLKKKEYLAMLKAKGIKPNKAGAKKKPRKEGGQGEGEDSDAEERQENARARPEGRRCAETMEEANMGAEGKAISVSIGGTFPIGEVISESFDLSKLNGACRVFAYPGLSKEVTLSSPKPFTMFIEEGCVTRVDEHCPAEFVDLLSLVRQAEGGKCCVRELGIGLNPHVGRQHVLADVTSFERQWGIHLSLGQRHPLFVKQKAKRNADGSVCEAVKVDGPVLKRKAGKYHIDVFIDAAELQMGSFSVDYTAGAVPSA